MSRLDRDVPWDDHRTMTPPHGEAVAEKRHGSLEYVAEQGENGSVPTYQEASGAPVETRSPLGYRVEWFTIIFLNIGQMVGTGVFSTPANILNRTGSVGLSMIYWVIGFIIGCCGLATFLELASYFPARSGSEVVFLEQAYPRPKWFFPTAFALQSVVLSFSSSNAIVMARYIFRMTTTTPTDWQLKGVAVGCYSLAIVVVILNNRAAILASNGIGVIKVLTLVFISITGFVVLGGRTRVADPMANFQDPFAGTTTNGFNLANALVNITFSYQGYENAFNVMGEVKNPIRTIKRSAPLSLFIVAVLYILCNVAYFAAIPKATIAANEQVTASLFFSAVFGTTASRGLNFVITLSAFGNLISVLIGQSRVIREIGRQGVLPFPKFWVTTRPFGTPIGPYLLKWGMTILMIVAPPAGDAFNFVVDLANYPNSFFLFLMAIGVYLIRRQRKRADAPKSEFKAWDAAIILFIASKIFLLVMPWYPPAGGIYAGSVSFFYATSSITGIAIIVACAVYYYVWVHLIPKARGYRMRQTVLEFDDGAVSHSLVKVPVQDLHEWDATHDPAGKLLVPDSPMRDEFRSRDEEIKV